jgi:hypothetical protein
MVTDVHHLLARHAVEHVPPDDALLLAIEALLEVAEHRLAELPVSAVDLAPFDEELLEPVIRRGQAQGIWSSAASSRALALSLRSLIVGLFSISRYHRQEPWVAARSIRVLFSEAAANAADPQRSPGTRHWASHRSNAGARAVPDPRA